MGNSLPSIPTSPPLKSVLKPLAAPLRPLGRVLRPCRSFPSKIKNFANRNVSALVKRGLKLNPRSHLQLSIPANHLSLQEILKFLNGNRMRISCLTRLSFTLDSNEIIPLMMTAFQIRPLVKTLGKRLSRLRSLEHAEIGSTHLHTFCIEETLIEALTKMKKISSLSLKIPDNQVKINFIGKKLMNLKMVSRLNMDFGIVNANIKPILNSLKCLTRLKYLRIDLENCEFTADTILKLAETIKKLHKLEYLIIHMENTSVQDEELKLLYETIDNHKGIKYFKIYVDGCSKLSWLLRARIYSMENFNDRC